MTTPSATAPHPHDGQTLSKLLVALEDEPLCKVLSCVLTSCREIATLLRTTDVTAIAGVSTTQAPHSSDTSSDPSTRNAFGDVQLNADVKADDIILDGLKRTGVVHTVSSEEKPYETVLESEGRLSVAYDPLDGSSILPTNFAVGTIVGVWRSQGLVGSGGRDITAALAVVYGSRTTVFIATRGWQRGVREAVLLSNGEWGVASVRSEMIEGKLFAPANLRASGDNEGYRRLMDWYISQRYTLRYTGGMVPDVTQLYVKGFGVFVSPVSPRAPAKLRLVYEAMPMAFLTVMAGGCSSDGDKSLLKREIEGCEQRTGVCLGSAGEVDRFEKECGEAAGADDITCSYPVGEDS